jgi:hypothetical protein
MQLIEVFKATAPVLLFSSAVPLLLFISLVSLSPSKFWIVLSICSATVRGLTRTKTETRSSVCWLSFCWLLLVGIVIYLIWIQVQLTPSNNAILPVYFLYLSQRRDTSQSKLFFPRINKMSCGSSMVWCRRSLGGGCLVAAIFFFLSSLQKLTLCLKSKKWTQRSSRFVRVSPQCSEIHSSLGRINWMHNCPVRRGLVRKKGKPTPSS